MLSKSYPKCIHSLNKWLQQCGKRQELYNKLNPQLFDVTLKDGLYLWTMQEKKTIYYRAKFNHDPKHIELGSLGTNVSQSQIFLDSLELHNSIKEDFTPTLKNTRMERNNSLFLLTPSLNALKNALDNKVKNFSFITSVSNAFQKNNTNSNILETKKELHLICNEVKNRGKVKLYVSCINDCPLTGQIDNDYIVHELLLYEQNQIINEVCLTDTCGTLKFEDFEYIIDNCLYFGLPAKKLSLNLQYSAKNLENTKQIMHYAFDKNINRFDVSMMECTNNLTYELFYKFLVDYIEKRASPPI
jgi:hypothetical protein